LKPEAEKELKTGQVSEKENKDRIKKIQKEREKNKTRHKGRRNS
jgi:hypothetical protein